MARRTPKTRGNQRSLDDRQYPSRPTAVNVVALLYATHAEEGGNRRVATTVAAGTPADDQRPDCRDARLDAWPHPGRVRPQRVARRRDLPAVPARPGVGRPR